MEVENTSPPVITFPRVRLTHRTFLYRSTESLFSGHRLLDGGSGFLCVIIGHDKYFCLANGRTVKLIAEFWVLNVTEFAGHTSRMCTDTFP